MRLCGEVTPDRITDARYEPLMKKLEEAIMIPWAENFAKLDQPLALPEPKAAEIERRYRRE